jgi:hypothetical protein
LDAAKARRAARAVPTQTKDLFDVAPLAQPVRRTRNRGRR